VGVIEVNPRPGATLDILDGNGAPLWRLHLDGVAGRLPHAPPRGPSRARASAIAYATGALRVPRSFRWPEWAADRAAPLSLAPPGAPVCTALAEAATASGARDLACRRAAAVVSHFEACMASSGTPL
jgi:uncharacterized protein